MSRAASNVTRSGESRPMPLTLIDVADDLDVELPQQLPRDRAGGHARGGFARAGALEHVANVGAVVLDDAGKVGMARARPRDDRPCRAGGTCRRLFLGVHRLLPVFPVLVANQQRDRRAERFAGAHARKDLGLVGLDGHPAAAAVAALAPLQLLGDGVEVESKAGRHAFENGDEALAMRLAGSEKTQHCPVILYEVSALSGRGRAQSGLFSRATRLQMEHASHAHTHRRSISVLSDLPAAAADLERRLPSISQPANVFGFDRAGRHARRTAGVDRGVRACARGRRLVDFGFIGTCSPIRSDGADMAAPSTPSSPSQQQAVSGVAASTRVRRRRAFSMSTNCRMCASFACTGLCRASFRSSDDSDVGRRSGR